MGKDSKIVVLDKNTNLINTLVPSNNSTKLLSKYFNFGKLSPKKRLTDEEYLQIAESEVKRLNVYNKALQYANANEEDENVFVYELKGFNLDFKDVKLSVNSKYSNKYQISYLIFKEKTFVLSTNVIDLLYNCSSTSCKEYSYNDVIAISLINDFKEIYKEMDCKKSKKKIKAIKTEINYFFVEISFTGSIIKIPVFLGDSTISTINEIKGRLFDKKI